MSSILEKFFILYSTNADDVEKGADKAGKANDKLEHKIKNTGEAAHHLGERFKQYIGYAVEAIAVMASADRVFEGFKHGIEFEGQMYKTAKSLGVSAGALAQWDAAVQISGGQTGEFAQGVDFLTKNLATMGATGKSRILPFLKEMGISAKEAQGPILGLFPKIAAYFETIDKQKSKGIGERLGLSQGTILLLQSGRRSVQELVDSQSDLGASVEQNGAKAEEFEQQWTKLKLAFLAAGEGLTGPLLEPLTHLLNTVTHFAGWISKNGEFVKDFFISLGVILAAVGVEIGVISIPLIALTAFFLALAVVSAAVGQELAHFFNDQDSWLTRYLGKWSDIKQQISDKWNELVARFHDGANKIRTALTSAFDYIKDHITAAIQWLTDKINGLLRLLGLADKTSQKVSWKDDKFTHTGNPELDAARQRLIDNRPRLSDVIPTDPATLLMAHRNVANADIPISSASNGSIAAAAGGTKNSTLHIDNINIQTQATDSDGIMNSIFDSTEESYRKTVAQFDDGRMI